MPTKLPEKSRPKQARIKAVENDDSHQWLILWALSIGLSAIFLAAIIYVDSPDSMAAAMVLFFAAAIMVLVVNHDIDRSKGD